MESLFGAFSQLAEPLHVFAKVSIRRGQYSRLPRPEVQNGIFLKLDDGDDGDDDEEEEWRSNSAVKMI